MEMGGGRGGGGGGEVPRGDFVWKGLKKGGFMEARGEPGLA